MSKVAIVGNPSGTGVFTIQSPNTSTDRTLTLPDSTGTIDTLQRAGNVLQVVQGTYKTNTTITSTSYVDTNLTASITPSSASNKVLVISTIPYMIYSENGDAVASIKLVRNSTDVTECISMPAHYASGGGQNYHRSMLAMNYLDSPSSTSVLTYKLQGKINDGTSTEQFRLFQDGTKEGAIILMEIAA